MKVLAFILILLVQACSNKQEANCSSITVLTTVEAYKLKQIVMNNHFLSGCVTELISDLRGLSTSQYQKHCTNEFANTLGYAQWLEIYNTCMVR